MSSVHCDCDAWYEYPQHRWIFNKLGIALDLGYMAGPSGVAVPHEGEYIIRPVYNLAGMGAGARRAWITPYNKREVNPGEFWCEFFQGPHISVDYSWNTFTDGQVEYCSTFAAQGFRTHSELYRFNSWTRVEPPAVKLPNWIYMLRDVPDFNVEFIGNQIIEIHLCRSNDFPEGATDIIPVWEDSAEEQHFFMQRTNWKYYENFDDADGNLPCRRLGFYYR